METLGQRAPRTPRLDHGMIGNGNVIALIAPTGAMEWLCMPRFDSPSLFARLLDADRGGVFRFLWEGEETVGVQRYVPNTNVLTTRFERGDAAWEVIDFAPRLPSGWGVAAPVRVVRIVRPIRGVVRLRVDFDPRLDYARGTTTLAARGTSVEVRHAEGVATLHTDVPHAYVVGGADFVLTDAVFFDLAWGHEGVSRTLAIAQHEMEETVEGWRRWARTCALPLYQPELVLRSALCLKAHASEDTGAIIAATTTSIPEALGTPRTWDYRFCWLRDAAFTVEALRRLSHLREGERFLRFLRDVAEAGPLQPVYALDGARDLPEQTLDHLAGFCDSGPVRIGNAASTQSQNDLMGELVLCLESLLTDPRLACEGDVRAYLPLVSSLVEEAIVRAPRADTGIWEFRTLPRNYTFSRAMCWAATQRGARIARDFGQPDLAARWERVAAEEREVILARAFNPRLGYFTQALDGEHPDASNLLLPTLGLVDARDPRFLSTLDAYERRLTTGGLMQRYRHDDDFGATTSAFTICSFWWAEALALAGRLDAAAEVFERVARYANPVGLFSEDVDPATGALLGNFPQAYTHVGLIHAAITIGELTEARDGKVRAWT